MRPDDQTRQMQTEASSFTKTLTSTVDDDAKKQITNASVVDQNQFLYMELLGQGAFGKVRKCRPKQAGSWGMDAAQERDRSADGSDGKPEQK